MIDRQLFKTNPELIKASLKKRGEDSVKVDQIVELEQKWRDLTKGVEQTRSELNSISRGGKPSPSVLIKAKKLSAQVKEGTEKLNALAAKLRALLLSVPNLVSDETPVGEGESANQSIKKVRVPMTGDFQPHHKLMIQNGWLNQDAAAQNSGSRFRYLTGDIAWAERVLMDDAIRLAIKNGFKPVIPPVMTRRLTLEDAGFLPFAEDDIFKIENEDLYLTGTSEQSLLAMFRNKVFKEEQLPIRLVGFSSCFRREVGSYGKDVEGIFRQHQFDKVELISLTTPDKAEEEHQLLVSLEEKITNDLRLPYQVVAIGSGDLGPTTFKKFDIEVWFPSQQRYRETHSASNCLDFQSRRLNTKYLDNAGNESFVYSLNGTLATERLLLAVVENNQRPDGTVKLPRHWRI